MIPGLTTRISEGTVSLTATITPKSDLIRVTSTATTTVVATIVPPFAGFSGIIFVANNSGASITTVTSGNIQTAVTVLSNRMAIFIYSKLADKWFICQDT